MNDYSYIGENLKRIRDRLSEAEAKSGNRPKLMAVTKTVPAQAVNEAVRLGVTLLGENRVQEYLSKCDDYDKSAQVHIIGHLQTNKVKYIINNVSMIQSVDSIKLASEINRLAKSHGTVMDILCEVNIGGEESKSGVSPDDLIPLLTEISQLENVRVKGLMTIPPPSDSDIFLGRMEELFRSVSQKNIPGITMQELSMGMTNDYYQAALHGSTLVRIGTGLFGARDYSR
ncbi:MAG: YggS family pyridoxal phosphate-dependent enzyme [Ruminococcus sp.]|nr:YggS family pyridoxal phosphate-dependent enzyme [Ruminococcus sp.]